MKAATQQQENKKKQQAARLAAKAEHLDALKADLADNDRSMRSIGEHMLKVFDYGATQREVAEVVGRSQAWINRIVKWAKAGYAVAGPFSAESKAKRKRNFDQAPNQSSTKGVSPAKRPAEDARLSLGANYPPTDPPCAPVHASAERPIEAVKAAGAALAAPDDLTIPDFMRRTPAGAQAPAAALNGSGAMTASAEVEVPPAKASADDVIIETPSGAVLAISQPRHFIRRVGRAEAEAFCREVLAELGADAPSIAALNNIIEALTEGRNKLHAENVKQRTEIIKLKKTANPAATDESPTAAIARLIDGLTAYAPDEESKHKLLSRIAEAWNVEPRTHIATTLVESFDLIDEAIDDDQDEAARDFVERIGWERAEYWKDAIEDAIEMMQEVESYAEGEDDDAAGYAAEAEKEHQAAIERANAANAKFVKSKAKGKARETAETAVSFARADVVKAARKVWIANKVVELRAERAKGEAA